MASLEKLTCVQTPEGGEAPAGWISGKGAQGRKSVRVQGPQACVPEGLTVESPPGEAREIEGTGLGWGAGLRATGKT